VRTPFFLVLIAVAISPQKTVRFVGEIEEDAKIAKGHSWWTESGRSSLLMLCVLRMGAIALFMQRGCAIGIGNGNGEIQRRLSSADSKLAQNDRVSQSGVLRWCANSPRFHRAYRALFTKSES